MSQHFAILLAEQAVREFVKQWNAGLQPCLLLETHSSGAILVSSKVTAGVTLPDKTEDVFPPPQMPPVVQPFGTTSIGTRV